jgi:tetratricopeptide (TPR) repeat protein/predicted Ser/Thr protein kinase
VIGRHVSHFYVIRAIGAGGMGIVYEAQDTRLPRSVAIKVLRDDMSRNVEAIRRFKQEARLASSLNHPNICTILDVSESESQAFIAMEFLDGQSLKTRLGGERLSSAEIFDIIRQIASALVAAHDCGIIHRDITPANIFLTATGLVKLLDFGLATHFPATPDIDADGDPTTERITAGTIHYMAPELLTRGAAVDHRCDFYALGAVIYEMATGVKPFPQASRKALIDAIRTAPHVPIHHLGHHPPQLGRLVDKLLAKSPDERYQTAAALKADIDAAGLTPEMSTGPAGGYSTVPSAYHAFKRGKQHWRLCHEGGWRAALSDFDEAIALDPQFARALVARANAYNFLGFYSIVKPGAAFAAAADDAQRAVSIDGRLAPAFIELGLARFGGEWDWDAAEAAFRRGLLLDPTDAMAHVHYSWLLILLGRADAANAEADRALALAPSSRLVATGRAQTLFLSGAYDEAYRACTECLRFDPDYVFAIHLRGLSLLAQRRFDAAASDLERAANLSGRAPFYLGLLGRCYAEQGLRAQAWAIIEELNQLPADTYVPPQCYVFVYAALGEREQALERQEDAYADGASPFNYLFPGLRELYARTPYHKHRLAQMRLVV